MFENEKFDFQLTNTKDDTVARKTQSDTSFLFLVSLVQKFLEKQKK